MYNGKFYKSLKKPSFTPSPIFFKIAWGLLYFIMFLALLFVFKAPGGGFRTKALHFFLLQFLLNMLWSPIFFVFEMPKAALLLTIMLVITVGVTVYYFAQVSLIAFLLLLPYWFWVCFVCFLNWKIVVLNPDKRL